MACANTVLAKKVPVSIPGSEWSLGGLDPQGLSGFTDYFRTCFHQRVALFNGLTGHFWLALFAGHSATSHLCQSSMQMPSVVQSHDVSGFRMPQWWETAGYIKRKQTTTNIRLSIQCIIF